MLSARDKEALDDISTTVDMIPTLRQWSETPTFGRRRKNRCLSTNDGNADGGGISMSRPPSSPNQPSWVKVKSTPYHAPEDEWDERGSPALCPAHRERENLLGEPHIRVLLIIYGIYAV